MHRFYQLLFAVTGLLLAAGCRSTIYLEFAQAVTNEGTLAACNLAQQKDKQAKTLFPRAVKAMRKARLTAFEPDSVNRRIVSVQQLPDKLKYSNLSGTLQLTEKDMVIVYAERWRNLDVWVFSLPAELNPTRADLPRIAFPVKDLERAIRKKLDIRYKTVSESDFNYGHW